jgi:propionyl-CoA synthetase
MVTVSPGFMTVTFTEGAICAIARPKAVHFVSLLPKTRSGKTLRRSIQALAEGRDPGDLTTIEDPGALEQIRGALKP